MNNNKLAWMIAASAFCLCVTSYAMTEAWHVSLNTSGDFDPTQGWQVIPDGSGGVACAYTVTITNMSFTVIQWFNAKGGQIYQTVKPDTWMVYIFDKNHLVYGADDWVNGTTPDTSCVVVDKRGTETPIANFHGSFPYPQPVQGDKKGFFFVRYTGTGADAELVRFLYK
ncbi:MAG TPA: hypothetical protein VL486_09675 [Verrucomicrobiae bacterium]|nr:hypothetical protein [Verrucomicrobiae bacterium]